jgi:hypothetical protein
VRVPSHVASANYVSGESVQVGRASIHNCTIIIRGSEFDFRLRGGRGGDLLKPVDWEVDQDAWERVARPFYKGFRF